MIRAAIVAAAALVLSGCSSVDRWTAAESTFHALNVIDQAQSINAIARDCYLERDPVTSGLFGDKPASGQFALYGLAISVVFNAFNRAEWVQDRPALRAVVDILAIGAKGYAVAHNHSIGMRVAGDNAACAP